MKTVEKGRKETLLIIIKWSLNFKVIRMIHFRFYYGKLEKTIT